MFIIFGTTGIKSRVSEEPELINSCPNCGGTLSMKNYKRWFTLFFIPVFPIETIDTFFECHSCKNAYTKKIKSIIRQGNDEKEKVLKEAKAIFAKTLIATMTHMATIDGDFAIEEKQCIENMKSNFADYQNEINEAYNYVLKNGNKENYVFNLLNKSREVLSTEGLLSVLAQSAEVLLADGRIDKEEEALMKEYLVACGLPKDMYKSLLDKISEKETATQ